MLEKFEKQLQVGGWVLVAVFLLSAVWLWQSIDRMNSSGNVSDTFSVSGTGKISARPDIAVADIAISVEAVTANAAQDDANRKSNAVVDYLKNTGIKTEDIKTSGYNISPQYDYADGRTRIRGYQVTQSLTVKIRDLDKANTVIDGVVNAGANQVSSVRFELDNPEKVKSEARELAIADAKSKAEVLARQLGISLGSIVAFSESGDYTPPVMFGRDASGGTMIKAESVPAPALPAGEDEIVISVTITYQLK